jgi:hypothetical protein
MAPTREDRIKIIQEIQNLRGSIVLTYITSDRQGCPPAQMSTDAIRPMYDHLKCLGFQKKPKIDLFIYSHGGDVSVPWPMVTMLREFCTEFNILIPYCAHSAATLIALGADNIVMGRKGELGPIDPLIIKLPQGDRPGTQELISVEDIMAYISFLKDRAGLGDQAALAQSVNILAEKLTPWTIGSMYRTYSHIRMIARKLLTSHQVALDERKLSSIIETMAEKMYFHGHAIGRKEANDIGLPIQNAIEQEEQLFWDLLESYESLMQLRNPVDPNSSIPMGQESCQIPIIFATIESETRLDLYTGDYRLTNIRQIPPQLNLNLGFNLTLPANIPLESIPQESQQILQLLIQQIQQQGAFLIQQEIQKQAPIINIVGSLLHIQWVNSTNNGI